MARDRQTGVNRGYNKKMARTEADPTALDPGCESEEPVENLDELEPETEEEEE